MQSSLISFIMGCFRKKVNNQKVEMKQNGHGNPCNGLLDLEETERRQAEIQPDGRNSKAAVTRVPLYFSLTAVITSLAVLIFVSVTFVRRNNNSSREPGLNERKPEIYHEVCIDCMKLAKNPYNLSEPDSLLKGLTTRKMDDVLKCCSKNQTQMSIMFEAILRNQDAHAVVLKETSEKEAMPGVPVDMISASVSVHKHMTSEYTESSFSTTNQNFLKFTPEQNDPLTEHVRGVTVLEDGIVVQHTGFYYLYNSVCYTLDRALAGMNKKLTSFIYRTRPNSAQSSGILLKSVHTSCENCDQESATAFTGGVFLLKAGDFIQVFLSSKGIVDFNKESTYLGLVMLGEKSKLVF